VGPFGRQENVFLGSVHNRIVQKPQFLNSKRLKNDKKHRFCQKPVFFGRPVEEPTGFLNKPNVSTVVFSKLQFWGNSLKFRRKKRTFAAFSRAIPIGNKVPTPTGFWKWLYLMSRFYYIV
jgi:hypothetical protein